MTESEINIEQERLEILRQYKRLIEVWDTRKDTEDRWLVRKAFKIALEAHKDMRRKSGEPFILHPIAVAIIAAKEIGLGRTSIISALLHDTVEDTQMTLDTIKNDFGNDVAKIIDGLTKIEEIPKKKSSAQAETLKKIIYTLTIDIRIILIKLADRLHNMRTLGSMPHHKQLRVISETQYLFAPLANRLGLHAIKSELEELSFKYSQPKLFAEIVDKIARSENDRNILFENIKNNLAVELQRINCNFEIKLNTKTAHSIWQKMRNQEVSFENIYNTFSIDVILDAEPLIENQVCWSAYSVISEKFKSNSKRLRDWLSTPKTNGYKAIHATIMDSKGSWFDLHIRSTRMDDIADKGYAAYWKYKNDVNIGASFETLLNRIKLHLQDNDDENDTFDFINDLKKDLFSEDIIVYTPTGQEINLPADSTVLDFAYTIHTDLGNQCIGGFIKTDVFPIGHKLKSGDQIDIWTSQKQKPNDEWYKYVNTASAKTKIAKYIKNIRKEYKKIGEEKLKDFFKQIDIDYTKGNINLLLSGSSIKGHIDLFYFIAQDMIGLKEIKEIMLPNESRLGWLTNLKMPFTKPKIVSHSEVKDEEEKADTNIDDQEYISDFKNLEYTVSKCCNPIPGDNVMGIVFPNEPIQIHLTECPTAIRLMSQHGKNIVKAKWKQKEGLIFLAGINIKAIDSIGLIKEIIKPITEEFDINVRSFNLKSSEGLADMDITVYVTSTKVLKKLITQLKKIKSIIKVTRLDKI
ncbi:MAG: RelA/SpoT family protein [Bacteroidota bacterium]